MEMLLKILPVLLDTQEITWEWIAKNESVMIQLDNKGDKWSKVTCKYLGWMRVLLWLCASCESFNTTKQYCWHWMYHQDKIAFQFNFFCFTFKCFTVRMFDCMTLSYFHVFLPFNTRLNWPSQLAAIFLHTLWLPIYFLWIVFPKAIPDVSWPNL